MPSTRVRNYVKKNPERVEEWRRAVLRLHIIRVLTEAYGEADMEVDFSADDITRNRGQINIFNDVMREHYVLGRDYRKGTYGHTFSVNTKVFGDMTKDIGVKPELKSEGHDRTNECDIYTVLKDLSLESLAYIYWNQDEFVFMPKDVRRAYSSYSTCGGLGVYFKALKEEADHLAFRNALDEHYANKMGTVCEAVFGLDCPDLTEIRPTYGKGAGASEENVTHSYASAHKELLPPRKEAIDEHKLDQLIGYARERAAKFQNTLEQLEAMRASYLEAGGDETFSELYYQKMIDYFYLNLPLFLNSEDKRLKDMAARAARKEERYH